MVTGIGGVFIKSKDPKFLARWYDDNLGIGFGKSLYFSFKWRDYQDPSEICNTVFSFFREDTTYFYPGTNDMMINLRVNDLDDIRIRLKNEGIFVADKIETFDYGRFGWTMDPEGNKIELWEPVDKGFEDFNDPMDLHFVTGLGGVFMKCTRVDDLMKWYSKHFGLFFTYSAHTFQWKDFYKNSQSGQTVFSFFKQDSSYFSPSEKNFMLNFRVRNLDEILKELRSSGIEVIENTESYEYGKFGWLVDPEGNKIELWEPVDE